MVYIILIRSLNCREKSNKRFLKSGNNLPFLLGELGIVICQATFLILAIKEYLVKEK